MSKFQNSSNKQIIDDSELRVEEISSSNPIFFNSLKRKNTKTWYNNANEEQKTNTNFSN